MTWARQNIRCNLVSAGPDRLHGRQVHPGLRRAGLRVGQPRPLEWDLKDPEPAGRGVVALLSDWFPKTTGEIVHVDGGLHAVGA
ncbi:SDR family oxidoreductase [Streptomyces thinghirensis]|nr:SDR family oxidoreductase [Streptomyces thinghirensis]